MRARPDLRVVSRVGVGYDAIDTAAAADHNVVAMIAAGSNDTTVAESAVTMILAMARELCDYVSNTARGDWTRGLMNEIRGKTIGVVGLGRIGRSVVRRLAGFEAVLIAAEPYPDQQFVAENGIELVELDDLFRRADYVTLHVNTTPETANMVNERRLGLMKPTAYLVNTARGGLVDEDALYTALTQGGIAGRRVGRARAGATVGPPAGPAAERDRHAPRCGHLHRLRGAHDRDVGAEHHRRLAGVVAARDGRERPLLGLMPTAATHQHDGEPALVPIRRRALRV